MLNQRIIYASLFYLLLIVLIIVTKPIVIFDERGNVRPFGIGQQKTIFSLGVVVVALSVISFYIFCIIDLIFANYSVEFPVYASYGNNSYAHTYASTRQTPKTPVAELIRSPSVGNLEPLTDPIVSNSQRVYSRP